MASGTSTSARLEAMGFGGQKQGKATGSMRVTGKGATSTRGSRAAATRRNNRARNARTNARG